MADPDYNYIRVRADTVIDPLIRRLTDPPFGTETSERNLMAEAAATIARLTAENEALRAQICELEESQANNTDWRDCRWKLWMWLLTKPGVESIELVDGGEDAVLANFQTAIEAMCEAQIGAVLQEAADACGWDEKSKTAILALNPEAIAANAKQPVSLEPADALHPPISFQENGPRYIYENPRFLKRYEDREKE